MPDMTLPRVLNEKIIEYLISLPNIDDVRGRQAFLYASGVDKALLRRMPFDETPANFVPLVVSLLLEYGRLHDGTLAIEAVLHASQATVGKDKAAYCETLIQEIQTAFADQAPSFTHSSAICRFLRAGGYLKLNLLIAFIFLVGYLGIVTSPLRYSSLRILRPLLQGFEFLDLLEAKTQDFRFLWRGSKPLPQPAQIAIVGITDDTVSRLGRWQTHGRLWLAEAITILAHQRAAVIGLDLTLSAHSETMMDQALVQAIAQAGNVVVGMVYAPTSDVMMSSEEVAALQTRLHASRYNQAFTLPDTVHPASLRWSIPQFNGVIQPLPEILDAAAGTGHLSLFADVDGTIRRVPLLLDFHGDWYPAFSLEVARMALGRPVPLVHAEHLKTSSVLHAIQFHDVNIPVNNSGSAHISYYGDAQAFPYYEFADIIEQSGTDTTFRNKIVLIGMTAPIFHDVYSTPFQASTYPGVEIHATILENMLRGEWIGRPSWTEGLESLLIVGTGVILGIGLPRVARYSGGRHLFPAGLAFVVVKVGDWLFADAHVVMNLTVPLLSIGCYYLAFLLCHEKRKSKTAMRGTLFQGGKIDDERLA